MTRAGLRPFCTVCHAYYRPPYSSHILTGKHRRATLGPRLPRASVKRNLRIPRKGAYRRVDHEADDKVSVDEYVRRPPWGPPPLPVRKTIDVRHHWRREPYIASRIRHHAARAGRHVRRHLRRAVGR